MVGNAQAQFLDEEGREGVKSLLAPHEGICGEIISSRKGRSSPDGDGWQEVIWLVQTVDTPQIPVQLPSAHTRNTERGDVFEKIMWACAGVGESGST